MELVRGQAPVFEWGTPANEYPENSEGGGKGNMKEATGAWVEGKRPSCYKLFTINYQVTGYKPTHRQGGFGYLCRMPHRFNVNLKITMLSLIPLCMCWQLQKGRKQPVSAMLPFSSNSCIHSEPGCPRQWNNCFCYQFSTFNLRSTWTQNKVYVVL